MAIRMTPPKQSPPRAFLTGATGYVGGRLGARLLEAGWVVRCLVRSVPKLTSRPWTTNSNVEIVELSTKSPLDINELTIAMRNCQVAYYLIHSMVAVGAGYAAADRELARMFGQAAKNADVKRIIYLGGLGEMGQDLSTHLKSRREVESCLAEGKVPVTVFRAAMIIGSGSASFEILRYLTERLPIMITPKWVQTQCQPIAIRDVLFYLVQCLKCPDTIGATLDIGGPEVLTYSQLIKMMASALGLPRRIIIPVPMLTPRLSSLWIHLITPLSFNVARPLADGLKNRVVCRDSRAAELMPSSRLSPAKAIELALGKLQSGQVETAWSDAGVMPGDPEWAGGRVFSDIFGKQRFWRNR
ncbi:MAG: NAD(P)H-binding protein [Phycisphaerae bacterium]